MPSSVTTLDDLYSRLNALITRATGRPSWRKGGVQAQPKGVFATVFISETTSMEKEVVENVELDEALETGETFTQVPWGTAKLEVRVEFHRSATSNSALQAANRLRSALRLEERFWDLWQVAALSGPISVQDVSGAFRADVEPRAEVRFSLWANVAGPLPLVDASIYDINSQEVTVKHVDLDEEETELTVTVEGEA